MSRLATVTIAQASATQRAGRAGRVAPGKCYRLWSESQRLDPATRPEIQQVELGAFALEVAVWGSTALRFLDPPPSGPLAQARELLAALGALDVDGKPTAHGRALLATGLHPRIANAIVRAPANTRGLACDLAALLEARDVLRGEARQEDDARVRLIALEALRAGRAPGADVDRSALARVDQVARQLRQRLQAAPGGEAHDAGVVLALAFPDRIARQDAQNPLRYQLANGRGARLHEASSLRGEPWLAVAELRLDDRDSLIQRAAPVAEASLRALYPEAWQDGVTLRFNRETLAVEAAQARRFAAIVLATRTQPTPRDEATAQQLLGGIRAVGLGVLPWTESLREWQARVSAIRQWCPELQLPPVDDETLLADLDGWLWPLLQAKARVGEIGAGEFAEAIRSRLDYAQRREVDVLAPTEIEVPSGQRRRLSYTLGEVPVLAVKLQEMFGLADTPRIARGRVPLMLHLLSPRQSPLQVTQDLRGFWERTYPEVRKEMKGRYPRHPWPEDPWTAPPTHRAKPRGT